MAVLALTSSLESSRNVDNVCPSAPSRTNAARAQQYTLEYCEIHSLSRRIVALDLVRIPFVGAERIT